MSIYFPKSARLILASLAISSFTRVAHAQTAAQQAPAAALQAVGPKRPGAVRIGIFMPQYELGGPGGPTAGESVRTVEEQYLMGPKIEIVRISALLPVQATAEAKEKQCDYVLLTSLTQKKSTGGFGALKTLSAATPMAAMIPGAGTAAMAASQSLAIASTTAVMASSGVKAKAEVTFEYSLNSVDGTSVLRDAQKAKARTDGEDVVTPMIQKAATNIVTLLNK